MNETLDKLRHDLTDKYVVVEGNVPELARFDGYVGQVKTVNMNGRALVQFDAWSNIGWYDIDTSYLKVVAKPDPAAVAKEPKRETPPQKAAPTSPPANTEGKKLSPLEMARVQGAAKSGTAKSAAAPKAESTAPAKPAPKPGGKLSTADILAAARANKAGGGGEAAAATASAEATTVAEAAPAAAKPAAKPAAAKAATNGGVKIKPGQLSVAEIIAWCRQHDSK